MIDTLSLTAEGAAQLIERREVGPEELTSAYADAIEQRNDELNAFLHVANEIGEGVPIALKDCITTCGVPTTAGSRILEGYIPVYDSTVSARCKEARLPLIGKANMDEFAMGSSTENSGYGPSQKPVGYRARPWRLLGGLGDCRRGRACAVGARVGHRRLDQATSRALRSRGVAADLRDRLAVRDHCLRIEP